MPQPAVTYTDISANTGPAIQRQQTIPGSKCFPLFIGGADLQDGQTNSRFSPFCCEALRCSACDKRIVRFSDNVKWADHVDYMFVRNFNTSVHRLREGVIPAPGYACYACQCQWLSINETKPITDFPQLRWHCRGH